MRTIARIAWLQLMHHPWRLAAAVSGIGFSAVLILMQTGLEAALFNGVTRLYANLGADLVMISPQYQSQVTPEPFARRALSRAPGIPGVRSADPMYVNQVQWKNPETRRERAIFLIGVPPDPDAIRLPGAAEAIPLLQSSRGLAFDEWSRPEYGAIAEALRAQRPVVTEVAGRQSSVVALFRLGASFAVDGTVLAGYDTFFRLSPGRRADQVDVGLITLEPGVNAAAVRSQLQAIVGGDVEVLTRQDLVDKESTYWADSLPIGFVLGMNAALGLVVGIVIVYQILYTDVTDNLPEYATLKALGFPDASLLAIVLCQGVILSALGYLPGLLISIWLYSVTQSLTFLELDMTAARAAVVYAVVLAMCLLAAAMAMRKVKTADPAEIF